MYSFNYHRPTTLDTAATYLGMTTDDLATALKGGKTLAQVAGDKGKTVDGLRLDGGHVVLLQSWARMGGRPSQMHLYVIHLYRLKCKYIRYIITQMCELAWQW